MIYRSKARLKRGSARMCPDENTLACFMQGQLADDVRSAVERHLDTCSACAGVLVAVGRAAFSNAGEPYRAPAPFTTGSRVGRYLIVDCVGRGAMGAVYAADDPMLGRRVALKVLHATIEDSAAQERLLREARALARLAHPNVVSVFDVGVERGRVFVAMEIVPGTTLRQWTEGRPWQQILDAYLQAAAGLSAAHKAGLLHRDFKPDNVLVGDDGRVRVTDFGLARMVGAEMSPQSARAHQAFDAATAATVAMPLTGSGVVLGTPAYMSPEQLDGLAAVPASDQWSFAVALYEALYGQRPFNGRTLDELRAAMRRPYRPPPSQVPPWVAAVFVQALSLDPAQRFPSMDAMVAQLRGNAPRADVHTRVNAVIQLLLCLMHTGLTVGILYLMLSESDPATGGPVSPDGSPVYIASFVIAVMMVGMMLTGWLPLGAIWTAINAYGLFRNRRWAYISTLVYSGFSLLSCFGTPFAVYALVSLWGRAKKKRDSAPASPS